MDDDDDDEGDEGDEDADDDDDEGEDDEGDEKPSWGAMWVLSLIPPPRWGGTAMAWFLSSLPRALVDRRDDDDDDGEEAEDDEDEEEDDDDDEDEEDDEEEEEEARVVNEAAPPRIVFLWGRGGTPKCLAGLLFKVLTTTFELRRSGCCCGAE